MFKLNTVNRDFGSGDLLVRAVNNVSFEIKQGEFTAIVGPSGSGKSTLLNMMSGLDIPTAGDIYLNGELMSKMKGNQLSDYRRDHIGFIFQSYNLIPVLTVKENIEYIMLLQGVSVEERNIRVSSILNDLGLNGKENRFPRELSGGQQQRVAVARAMVSQPAIILADEPTANLDSHTGTSLIEKMLELNEKNGMTFIFSTHDEKIMKRAKRLIVLEDGQIDKDITQN